MMTRKHFEWVADTVAPMVNSPLVIERIADDLASINRDRDKFVDRAIKAWERHNPPFEVDGVSSMRYQTETVACPECSGRWRNVSHSTRALG